MSAARLRKKIRCVAPQDRDRRVVGRDVDEQPVGRGSTRAPASTALITLNVERSTSPGVRAGLGAQALVLLHDVPRRASETMNSWPSLGAQARHVADLRLLDRERRRLAHLPAHELVEILRARGHLLEADERHLGDRIRHDEADAPGPPDAFEHAAERADDGGAVVDVGGGQRRHERAVGQRLGGVRRRRPACRRATRGSRPTRGSPRSRRRPSAPARRAAGAEQLIRRTSPC